MPTFEEMPNFGELAQRCRETARAYDNPKRLEFSPLQSTLFAAASALDYAAQVLASDSDPDPSTFTQHLEAASRIVKSWPLWKQNILAHSLKPENITARPVSRLLDEG